MGSTQTDRGERQSVRHPAEGYSDQPMPLMGRAFLMSVFAAVVATGALVGRRRGVRLPQQLPTGQIVAAGVATYKLSRIVAKDKVTTFARAPFTEFQESAGRGEVDEAPRGGPLQRAVGELLSCPYCVGVWIASGITAGLVVAPRQTRLVIATLNAVAISDALQMIDRRAAMSLR